MRSVFVGAVVVLIGCGVEQDGSNGRSEAALEITNFGSNPGALKMYLLAPSSPKPNAGLVVAMHGCTQTAAEYAKAGWNTFAQQHGFYVLYPEVPGGVRCFGWYEASNTSRGRGQAASIASAVAHLRGQYPIDGARIFVTGLSAGGGMASSMLASYPDVFSAGATMAGLPHGCADTIGGSGACQSGKDLSPQQWGDLARAAFPSFSGTRPRISIFNGDADYTVNAKNLTELMDQWTNVNGIDQVADQTSTVGPATRREYVDGAGVVRVETWTVRAMGHGTAVAASQGCGSAGGFVLDVGLCSTEHAARFFGLLGAVVPAPDAGQPVVDAGQPIVDAGQPIVDAGQPIVDAGPPVVDAGSGGACIEANDTNYAHTMAGRAVRCGNFNSYVCANGSGENVGLWNTYYRSWLKSTTPGVWSAGRCP